MAGVRTAEHNRRMTRPPIGDMLPLEFAPAASRLPERIVPMRPTEGGGAFDDPAYFFEPWWPGIRAFVLVEDGTVRLRAEALGDPTAAFPELSGVADARSPGRRGPRHDAHGPRRTRPAEPDASRAAPAR